METDRKYSCEFLQVTSQSPVFLFKTELSVVCPIVTTTFFGWGFSGCSDIIVIKIIADAIKCLTI